LRRRADGAVFRFAAQGLPVYAGAMMKSLPNALMAVWRLVLLGGIWLILTGADPKGLAFGAFAVPVAAWLSLRLLPAWRPVRVWRLVLHLPSFLAGSVLGGLDVARRALVPQMPLDPGWVEAPARLSDGGRILMGAELSLMPGTLAAGMHGDRLLVHLLDTGAGSDRAIPREEAAIAAIMRDTPPQGPSR